jgi:hypothetical protein
MKSDLSALFNNAKKVTLISVPTKEEEPENEPIEKPKKKIKYKKFFTSII